MGMTLGGVRIQELKGTRAKAEHRGFGVRPGLGFAIPGSNVVLKEHE